MKTFLVHAIFADLKLWNSLYFLPPTIFNVKEVVTGFLIICFMTPGCAHSPKEVLFLICDIHLDQDTLNHMKIVKIQTHLIIFCYFLKNINPL